MNKSLIVSIVISILIWISVGVGYFYIKEKVASQVFMESNILEKQDDKLNEKPLPDLKEIIREVQKKVVMVELEDGTVGTGFLYNTKGDIITNAHVVAGFENVKVKTTDAKGYDGKVIGISNETDVAVIRVNGLKDTLPLPISYDVKLEIGDEILALGSPLGFQNTVTTGIISGTDRELSVETYKYEDVYQISAPIAPGNSGGPLIDRKSGRVVGINSARIEQENIGFSIPINSVLPLVTSWSDTPMEKLPSITKVDGTEKMDENKMLETADYLVSYFIESINFRDFVTAYSLLGSHWQSSVDYQTFRSNYLNIDSIKIQELTVNKENNKILVNTNLLVMEQTEIKEVTKNYKIQYEVAYENDQAKILTEKIIK